MTPTAPKPKKTPRPFDLKTASAELARLRRRAQRIEQHATAHLRQSLTAMSVASYTARQTEELIGDARAFLGGR